MAARETFALKLLAGDSLLTRPMIISSGHDRANVCALSSGAFALAISQSSLRTLEASAQSSMRDQEAAAAESLRQQAQELRGAVDVFRLA